MSLLARFKHYLGREHPEAFLAMQRQVRQTRIKVDEVVAEAARRFARDFKEFGPPSHTFSTQQRLIDAGRADQIILPFQEGVDMPEDSISRRSVQQHERQTQAILWERFGRSRLVSQSLAHVNEEKALNIEAAYGPRYYHHDPAYLTICHPEPVYLSGKWTSVISRWVPSNEPTNFAHWFYDALPRLAMLKYFPDDVGILIPEKVSAFHRDSLEILGVFDRCRPTPETHLIVEDYYFSSPVSMIVCWSPYAYDYLNENIRPAASEKGGTPKRFYIVRKGVARGASNEAEVQKFFTDRGWALVDTAELSLRDQIELFRNAEAICGLHGAGLINMQWSRPGTHLIEVFPSTFLSGGNEMIAKYQQLRYKAMIFPANAHHQTSVDLDELGAYLSEQGIG